MGSVQHVAGIDDDNFFAYFDGVTEAVGIMIDEVTEYDTPRALHDVSGRVPAAELQVPHCGVSESELRDKRLAACPAGRLLDRPGRVPARVYMVTLDAERCSWDELDRELVRLQRAHQCASHDIAAVHEPAGIDPATLAWCGMQ